jgi:probable HAF family extracellular repeat protein
MHTCISRPLASLTALWLLIFITAAPLPHSTRAATVASVIYLPVMQRSTIYTVTDLATTESPDIRPGANDITVREPTEDGQVALTIKTDAHYHSYRWQNGQLHELALSTDTIGTTVYSINPNGQMVGSIAYYSTISDPIIRAVHWSPTGEAQVLDTLDGDMSRAFGVNADGLIVGFATTADHDLHAVIWSGGFVHDMADHEISKMRS